MRSPRPITITITITRCLRGVILVTLLAVAARSATAKGGLQDLEKEFQAAIEKVSPATVICVPDGVAPENAGSSSGVIVSRDGYVLSDGDVGQVLQRDGKRVVGHSFQDEIDVRVPDLERGGFATHRAVVVRRMRAADTTLLKISTPPAGGFPDFLPPATSAHLEVGDFTFVMGNAFGLAQEAPPTLTAGVVASLTALPEGDAGGPIEFIYTSAAVNPGVNGGPCIDVEGRLVGTVSTWLQPVPGEPYQFLGKVVPIDRIRAVFEDMPEARRVFGRPPSTRARAQTAAALERVFHFMARRAYPAVVSLEVKRRQPLNSLVPQGPRRVDVPRYQGPVSGMIVGADGWVVTSLYNLTNTVRLLAPTMKLPPEAEIETGLRAIEEIIVHFPGGARAEAHVVAHDGRLGIALLKADLADAGAGEPGVATRPLPPAPAEAFAAGRFVLALGNPFGEAGNPDPLLTIGILSKQHAGDASQPWRGQWQTDAGVTDANCGGALVDLRGRLLGILQVWHPLGHGRNSGIGFVVPWCDVEAALPRLREGHSRARGRLGIGFREGATIPILGTVDAGTAAAKAGLVPGDRIVGVNGADTPTVQDVIRRLVVRWEGETLTLEIERDGKTFTVEVALGAKT